MPFFCRTSRAAKLVFNRKRARFNYDALALQFPTDIVEGLGARQRSDDHFAERRDFLGGYGGGAAGLLQKAALRGSDVVAVNLESGLDQIRRHRRAHDAQPDDAHAFHFFFFLAADFFFAGSMRFLPPAGFASTSTTPMTHG